MRVVAWLFFHTNLLLPSSQPTPPKTLAKREKFGGEKNEIFFAGKFDA